jgi:transcriptional regulator of met regulon
MRYSKNKPLLDAFWAKAKKANKKRSGVSVAQQELPLDRRPTEEKKRRKTHRVSKIENRDELCQAVISKFNVLKTKPDPTAEEFAKEWHPYIARPTLYAYVKSDKSLGYKATPENGGKSTLYIRRAKTKQIINHRLGNILPE